MDFEVLTWIGNIYEKFEAMCMEMEEVMFQDTVKYTENQVQTVGAGVKRFYAEVVQDLHPRSCMNPGKVAAADFSFNPSVHPEIKRKAITKMDATETDGKLVDDTKVISGRNRTGAYKRPTAGRRGYSDVNHSPVCGPIVPPGNLSSLTSLSRIRGNQAAASSHLDSILSSDGLESNSGYVKEKSTHKALDTNVSSSDASVDSAPATSTSSVLSTELKFAESRQIFSSSLSTDSSAVGECTNSGVVSETVLALNEDASFSKSATEEAVMPHKDIRRLDESAIDADRNYYDIIDPLVEIEPFNDSVWAETSLLAEGEKLHFIPSGTSTPKSYKKKFQEAFTSKKRSTIKEYKRLAVKHKDEHPNKESSGTPSHSQPADSSTEMSPATATESEWELL